MTYNRDIALLWDMSRAIGYIQSFTANLVFEEYLDDIRTISAVERQFSIMQDASRAISDDFRLSHPNITWQRIFSLKKILRPRYKEVDQDILWAIINSDLASLKLQIETVLSESPKNFKT